MLSDLMLTWGNLVLIVVMVEYLCRKRPALSFGADVKESEVHRTDATSVRFTEEACYPRNIHLVISVYLCDERSEA